MGDFQAAAYIIKHNYKIPLIRRYLRVGNVYGLKDIILEKGKRNQHPKFMNNMEMHVEKLM